MCFAPAEGCTWPISAVRRTRRCGSCSPGLQLLDGFSNTADHPAGRLPGMIEDAGFSDVESGGSLRTTWGSFELFTATG